jgi:hypothetical protein
MAIFGSQINKQKSTFFFSLERFNMPVEWLLSFKSARRCLVNARIGGRQAAHATPSQRFRLQLEALETRCLLSAADVLVVTTPPPSIGWPGGPGSVGIVAGTPFGMTVEAQNVDGTVDTTYNGSVTIVASAVGSTDPGYALRGTLTVTAINGVANFSGLTEDKVVQLSLIISGSGLPDTANAYTSCFTQAGPAAQMFVSGPASAALLKTNHSSPLAPFIYEPIAKAPFGLEVQFEDRLGNVTQYDGDVTIALATNPTGATLGGTLTVHSSGSFVDFTNVTLNNVGTGYTLQATAAGLTAGTSPAFAVKNQLVVTTQPPGSVAAGSSFGLVVKVEDGLGNVDTTFNGDVSASSVQVNSLGGTVTVRAVNGVATFTALTERNVGNDNLQLSVGPLVHSLLSDLPASVSTDYVHVTFAPATHLAVKWVWDGEPTAVSSKAENVLAGATFYLQVEAEDPFGHEDGNFNGSATLALANNPTGASLGGTLTMTITNGVARFDHLTIDDVGSGYTLTATGSNLTAGTSAPFDVTTRKLVATGSPPGSVTPGIVFGLNVAVEDSSGNVDTFFNGTVTVGLFERGPNPANLDGTVSATAVNGVATFLNLGFHKDWFPISLSSDGVAGTAITYSKAIQITQSGSSALPDSGQDPVSQRALVTVLYSDVFGRAPDSAGLSHWVGQLQMGASRQELAQAFWQSPEHRTLQVTNYYDTLLERNPDAAGLTQWVQTLENGASESAVEYGFLTSEEYLAKHPSSVGAFLNALYADVLGRTASAAEIGYWQSQAFSLPAIPTNSPPDTTQLLVDHVIASEVLYSPEASTHLIGQYFSKFLQRTVDPNGEQFWLAAVQKGASPAALAEAILGSDEYFTHVTAS